MNPETETQKKTTIWEPFPEPETFPDGWDLSEYLNAPSDSFCSDNRDDPEY
jgi:hypothetical protein